MKARLISYSQPTLATKQEGLENIQDLIAFCARVSNPTNQMNTETSDKLLRYLAKHKHWSPFEMASACFEIETTRDIARQLLRHRSFSFQEFSQRYADPTEDLDFEGLTVSRLYVNGTIRSWIHYIELRSDNGTQKEHMELARACAIAIYRIFPLAKEYVTE